MIEDEQLNGLCQDESHEVCYTVEQWEQLVEPWWKGEKYNKDVLIPKEKVRELLQKHSSCSLGNGCNFGPYKQCVSNIFDELGLENEE